MIEKPFPITVISELQDDLSRVAISAVIAAPFDEIKRFYRTEDQWCRAFFANIYVKACYKKNQSLRVFYNNNDEYQNLSDAFRFDYDIAEQTLDNSSLLIRLLAESGPLGSHDYELRIEAQPYSDKQSIIRLVYQSRYGFFARSALYIYLKTLGSGKIGFSRDADNQAVQGIRGILERNAMRYLLSLCAYLLNYDAAKPLATTLKTWHDYATIFSRELEEIDWPAYQTLKLKEQLDQEKLERHHGELWLNKDW